MIAQRVRTQTVQMLPLKTILLIQPQGTPIPLPAKEIEMRCSL
jgi:hypothetical protein